MRKALTLGIVSSALFAFTFILNRSMNLGGGFWAWSGSLRYFCTLIFLLPLMRNGKARPVISAIRREPLKWFVWSTVGFGLFYAPMTLASVFGEGWFVSATWQITIVCGILLTPLFGKRIPLKNVLCGIVILIGIALLQTAHLSNMTIGNLLTAFLLILAAAFAYPLGNRKMMQICGDEFSTLQRVFGMTLCSMPFWILVSIYALSAHGMPSVGQLSQSALVALFSGIAATLLFFEATRLVTNDPSKLALVEATQCGEVIFTLIGSVILLGDALPTTTGFIGLGIIVIGMIINSLVSAR